MCVAAGAAKQKQGGTLRSHQHFWIYQAEMVVHRIPQMRWLQSNCQFLVQCTHWIDLLAREHCERCKQLLLFF